MLFKFLKISYVLLEKARVIRKISERNEKLYFNSDRNDSAICISSIYSTTRKTTF